MNRIPWAWWPITNLSLGSMRCLGLTVPRQSPLSGKELILAFLFCMCVWPIISPFSRTFASGSLFFIKKGMCALLKDSHT